MSYRNNKTKIICTLGPASRRKETIAAMARTGMAAARINFSHGTHRQHAYLMENIRQVNRRLKQPIEILQDLEGYRIRVGRLKKPVKLKDGDEVWMSVGPSRRSQDIPLDFNMDVHGFKKDMSVYVSDGMIEMTVRRVVGQRLKLKVIHGGKITSKKGVNIPALKLKGNILTQKDKEDIAFGIAHKVDMVALSFVRNAGDMRRVIEMVRSHNPACRFVAKIENREGIRNLQGIIGVSDGLIVARGDLGVSLPIHELPVIQKKIIRQCNRRKKFVMTATQMLESMTEYTRPTRAEVTDVANAILDGSDYVMLSGETAVGKHPVETVRMMAKIIDYTERECRRLK